MANRVVMDNEVTNYEQTTPPNKLGVQKVYASPPPIQD